MTARLATALLGLVSLQHVDAQSQGREGHGLIGFGIEMYKPNCVHACRTTLKGAQLKCSDPPEEGEGDHMGHGATPKTSPECYATDDDFLTSVAYCISTHCKTEELWYLEQFWKEFMTGRDVVQPVPKWSCQIALQHVTEATTQMFKKSMPFNGTVLLNEKTYQSNRNGDYYIEVAEKRHKT